MENLLKDYPLGFRLCVRILIIISLYLIVIIIVFDVIAIAIVITTIFAVYQ